MNWGYAAALMCAKAIVREELWSAKLRDHDLKAELLRMIEWDYQVRYGTSIDTHYLGTRMNTWMDADVRRELHDCWGHFDSLDTARALHRTTALFTRLAQRVAAALEMSAYAHDAVHTEMESILRARPDLN